MLSVKIDVSDLRYLITSGLDKTIIDSIKNNSIQNFDTVYLNIDKNSVKLILDFLGNELMQSGINNNTVPNDYGIMIENLIDKFSNGFYGSSTS